MTAYAFDGSAFKPLAWQTPRTLRWAAWRPDGAVLLAVGNAGSVLLSDGGERIQLLDSGSKQNLRGAAWSPDGRTALLAGNRGAVLRLRREVIDELPAVTAENLRRVAWHPSGEYALVVGNAGTVLRYDAGSAALQPLPGDRAHTLRSVAFRPDGEYALVGAYASRYAGYPRPQPLYRCDGRYLQAALATDDEDDFVSIDWLAAGVPGVSPGSSAGVPGVSPGFQHRALVCGYAWRPDGSLVNKALLFDGAGWQTHVWPAPSVVLGGAWRPGTEEALLVGEGGLALRLQCDGSIEPLKSGSQDNLVGPFWKPDGSWALVLKGPSERVYTV
ncbi:MAG TPA: WD40 repeat domain-containing protein [Dehalococcoidia bacterium]